jgi:hypothetical protein
MIAIAMENYTLMSMELVLAKNVSVKELTIKQ